jgi:S-adenosylmethionine hydrolase
MQAPIISILTDFGTADGYVGTMAGVMLGIAPRAQLVDLSQEIAPQDVRQAAYVLHTAYPYFPPHTVHLVVVDPGVGSARHAIALRTPAGTFVGPDNGVFSFVMAREDVEAVVALENPQYQLPHVSHTFHGRDVFAPAAAHLAAGVPIADLGPAVADPIRFPPPRLEAGDGEIAGEVLHTDRFGNIITSIGILWWEDDGLRLDPAFEKAQPSSTPRLAAGQASVEIAGQNLTGIHRTYANVEPGAALALVGSEGFLEIAVREGNAALGLGVEPGDPVVVRSA